MILQNARLLKALIPGSLVLGATMPFVQAQDSLQRIAEVRSHLGTARTPEQLASARIRNKLTGIIVPKLEFRSTSLSSAIEFLRQESVRLDPEPDPQARGVNLILRLPAASQVATPTLGTDSGSGATVAALPSANTRLTLSLSRVPLLEALKYVANQAGLKVKVEPYAVSLVPLTESSDVLVTRTFRVPPDLIGSVTNSNFGGTALDQPASAAH